MQATESVVSDLVLIPANGPGGIVLKQACIMMTIVCAFALYLIRGSDSNPSGTTIGIIPIFMFVLDGVSPKHFANSVQIPLFIRIILRRRKC